MLPRKLLLIFAPCAAVVAYLATMFWWDVFAIYEADARVKPYQVRSPDGSWTLFVDSTGGLNQPQYRLAHFGELLWTKDLPCSLRDVQIANDGTFAGTATRWDEQRFLRLMVVGADGAARFDEGFPYEPTSIGHPGFPESEGVLFGPDDRVLFRVAHRKFEEWIHVRCSTGELLGSTCPRLDNGPLETSPWLLGVVRVTGTPLLACAWFGSAEGVHGMHFVLCDIEGRVVWRRAIPHSDETGAYVDIWAWRSGELLRSSAPKQFDFCSVADEQRVTFEISPDGSLSSGWMVREVDCEFHHPELDDRHRPPIFE